jgi:hypothetical protein
MHLTRKKGLYFQTSLSVKIIFHLIVFGAFTIVVSVVNNGTT